MTPARRGDPDPVPSAAPPKPAGPPPATGPDPVPWQRITVDVPGLEFEARPPSQYAFDFPDSECEGWSTDRLTLRFASVRGAKHRYYRQPRQDAARAAVHEATGSIVFAVADGVSSAAESHQGAVEACRAAVERILHLLDRNAERLDCPDVAAHAAERLRELARWRLGIAEPQAAEVARLYATTLVAGVVRAAGDVLEAEVFRIGDSGAWLLDRADGGYHPMFGGKAVPGTPLVSNEVSPLPLVPDRLETAVGRLAEPWTLLVGTDGFGDPLGEGDGRVGELFARHLASPPPPLWLGHVLDFTRETFDDDRTLLAIWPRAEGAT
ncbi:protein phosphatase 2C domain-containing protein [Streptomyces sp. NBC_01102]|uniref:protein phosphatase 2C domain-containing protein n=1 Tax=unclassified Streptomyces TaxID=2593676 RepID=UPI002DDB15BF|nr:protein phosphatase 2C domain-containing protein [Streptomyces sp. NBC_01237]WRZ76516.1 protein phosphatase 2C domain-containing protein [Streptomyces sp. NBC_01237]WSU70122.1 protein phosphatase 2C domain-containing protein [Streptomyces sp. NBC_01102]